MIQKFKNTLLSIGFTQQLNTLFSLPMKSPLNTTSNNWEVFAYFENEKYYFSTNGDLVSSFDCPDIDINFMLKKITYELNKYGCYLNGSKIVKEVDINNLESDLKTFILAVKKIDILYTEI